MNADYEPPLTSYLIQVEGHVDKGTLKEAFLLIRDHSGGATQLRDHATTGLRELEAIELGEEAGTALNVTEAKNRLTIRVLDMARRLDACGESLCDQIAKELPTPDVQFLISHFQADAVVGTLGTKRERAARLASFVRQRFGTSAELQEQVDQLVARVRERPEIARGGLADRLTERWAIEMIDSVGVDEDWVKRHFLCRCPPHVELSDDLCDWRASSAAEELFELFEDEKHGREYLASLAAACSDEQLANRLRETFELESNAREVFDPICLVTVAPSKTARQMFTVRTFLWWRNDLIQPGLTVECGENDLRVRVPACIDRTLNRVMRHGLGHSIEVFLPVSLLHDNQRGWVESWPVVTHSSEDEVIVLPGLQIRTEYPITIRPLDRCGNGRAWKFIQSRLGATKTIGRLSEGRFDVRQHGETVVLLSDQPIADQQELEMFVYSGIPILIWLREPSTETDVMDVLEALPRDQDWPTLYHRVYQHRVENQPAAEQLSLLCDLEDRRLQTRSLVPPPTRRQT
ncbi:MAG: hypothetical protein AAFU85_00375 [Planctomycetota bacterium]